MLVSRRQQCAVCRTVVEGEQREKGRGTEGDPGKARQFPIRQSRASVQQPSAATTIAAGYSISNVAPNNAPSITDRIGAACRRC